VKIRSVSAAGAALIASLTAWGLLEAKREVADAQSAATVVQPVTAVSEDELQAGSNLDWGTNGGTLSNQRYSPLNEINRDNVASLKGLWHVHLEGSGKGQRFSGEAQPIVHDGVIYIITGADDVFAVSVQTGEILWRHEAGLEPSLSSICCGWTSRGVALGEGKVFVGQLDGKLVALDQKSGEVVWSIQAERWQDGFSITSAPLYYDGMVITGFAGGEYGIRGRVKAFNAKTGEQIWTFYAIPGPGETGHDTWPKDSDAWKKGGGPVWQTPAVDPELGLLYFSVGNPAPDFNGSLREGDNLFTDSIVAIDAKTGKYRWHFQQVHHDIWDYDSANPVVLFDVTIGGQERKALVEVSKTGWAYILDRVTGKPLIGIEERPVPQEPLQKTSKTQPHPIGDAIVPQEIDIDTEDYDLVNQGRIFTPYWRKPTVVRPGQGGGATWPPSSYDPRTNTLFVCASDQIGLYHGGGRDIERVGKGTEFLGSEVGASPYHPFGVFAALDMKTNKLVWRRRFWDQCYSGSVATAGGLIFVGRNDGRFTALDSSNGHWLWQFQTGAGVNAPASVFEHDGHEMVLVYAAGNFFMGSARGDNLWMFALNGTLKPVPPAMTRVVAAREAPAVDNAMVDVAHGEHVYTNTCVFCHGVRGEGGHNGKPLIGVTDLATAVNTISNGRNQMPRFQGALSDQEIIDVAGYVTRVLNAVEAKR
jgi:quinohemoprotein ethanol dehydrogenase